MRILLGDSHPSVLWALRTMLEEQTQFEILGEAADAEGLLALATASPPDIALIDAELPGGSIGTLINNLHALQPSPVVIVMSSRPENGRRLLDAGANVFVSKTDQPAWLLETLQKFDKHEKP